MNDLKEQELDAALHKARKAILDRIGSGKAPDAGILQLANAYAYLSDGRAQTR